MDYKNKYNASLELAADYRSAYLEQGRTEEVEVLEEIFPELKESESEDEKIRKELLRFIKNWKNPNNLSRSHDYPMFTKNEEQCNKYIAWLEKQKTIEEAIQYLKENHSPSETSDFQTSMNIAVAKAYDKGMKDGLEKQGKQKPYSGVSFEYNTHVWGMCAREGGVEVLIDGELKAFISSEKSFVYPIHPIPNLTPKSALEAIKEEKVENQNCVKPAEWSEEDEYRFERLFKDCCKDELENTSSPVIYTRMEMLISFLDTLEAKEVDLEKHLKEDIEDVFFDLDGVAVKGATHYLTVEELKDLAKHFFELGLSVNNPITAADRGTAEEIIINLKRVEQDYRIDLTKEIGWIRKQSTQKGE